MKSNLLSVIVLTLIFNTSLVASNFGLFDDPTVLIDSMPINKQLYGRDTLTNQAIVPISGIALQSSGIGYDSIGVILYRNSIKILDTTKLLTYSTDEAPFHFNLLITAELANYTFELIGITGASRTIISSADSVVAGDVFIITGQSNAVAKQRSNSIDSYKSPFIRVYGNGNNDELILTNDSLWHIAQGNTDRKVSGNVGQWGLRLARYLVDSLQVPVAFFNNGHGGSSISFHARPSTYKTSLTTNYGRLYYRVNKANLKNKVKALFWYQGESDAIAQRTLAYYKGALEVLLTSWTEDFPNIEQFYVSQIRHGCNGTGTPQEVTIVIQEAQRQVAEEQPNVSLLVTNANNQYADECHFDTLGYINFARRLFPILNNDLYGASYIQEINFPKIVRSYMSGSTSLTLETDANSLSIQSTAEDFVLEDAGTTTILSISVSANNILLELSQAPPIGTSISYYGPIKGSIGKFIINSNNLEIPSFYKFTIDAITSTKSNLKAINFNVYPNPSKDGTISLNSSTFSGDALINIFNSNGSKVYTTVLPIPNKSINTGLKRGAYLMSIVIGSDSITKKILIE